MFACFATSVTDALNPAMQQLPGYKPIQQMVYCDFYPGGKTQYQEFPRCDGPAAAQRQFVQLLSPESSDSLGFGFRC